MFEKTPLKNLKWGKFWWIAKGVKIGFKKQSFKVAEFDRG
jgi:hypothetical protein